MQAKLKGCFITDGQPFREGAVAVFQQTVCNCCDSPRKAALTITALGLYEAEFNGKKVGTEMFSPGFTYYPRELQYQVYPVILQPGENTLRVYLAQGWYCGRFTYENKCQIYGEIPAAAWSLEGENILVTSADGDVSILTSPYDYAGFYDGEIYCDIPLTDTGRKPVPYTGVLPDTFVQRFNAVRLREEMPVQAVTKQGDAVILDFGQNFAGIISIDPSKLQNGATLRLRHGEILNADGSLYTTNLRKAKAELVYTKGTSTAPYTPRFTYMGFRYAELTGAAYVPGLITAHAIYSDMERTGYFQCTNEKVQQLYENQLWGQKSNYVEVPTDCPQRDERMGYTGDGHVFAHTGAYNFDTRSFWRKFLADIRYSQLDNSEGYVAPTIPAQGKESIGILTMLGWGNAVTLIPEMLYRQYGDKSFLTEQYDSIRQFVDCECRKCEETGLWMNVNLGDWLTLGKDVRYMAAHHGPVSNSFIVHDLEVASKLAAELGKTEDAARWQNQLQKNREAYLRTFVNEDGSMVDDYQGAYIMALRFVIPQGNLYEKVYEHLVAKIKAEGMQTGFFATQHILPLLADHGDVSLAYDLLLQPECPGWMYQVNCGATTIWERWDALRPDGTVNETKVADDNMVSFNHYAFGSVGEFYYRYILGIEPEEPGFAKVRIRPCMDLRLGYVSGSYQSMNGRISVTWCAEENGCTLNVETPVDTVICLPGGRCETVPAGKYGYLLEALKQ